MLADIDLAYAAGFLDADGCVTVSRRHLKAKAGFYSYRIAVMVSNKLPEVPEWMASVFGGSLKIQLPSKKAPAGKGYPAMFRWSLYNNKAGDFLEMVIPHLKIKRERAEAAVRLARMQRRRGCSTPRIGGKVIPIEELRDRESLAIIIRNANMKTSGRVAPIIAQEFA